MRLISGPVILALVADLPATMLAARHTTLVSFVALVTLGRVSCYLGELYAYLAQTGSVLVARLPGAAGSLGFAFGDVVVSWGIWNTARRDVQCLCYR